MVGRRWVGLDWERHSFGSRGFVKISQKCDCSSCVVPAAAHAKLLDGAYSWCEGALQSSFWFVLALSLSGAAGTWTRTLYASQEVLSVHGVCCQKAGPTGRLMLHRGLPSLGDETTL